MRVPGTLRKAGFTMVEVLLATAVLAALLVVIANLTSNTAKVTSTSNRQISADAAGRQILTRLSLDFSQAILRKDLPQLIEKLSGNDRITFYAQADGYEGDRGVSKIAFRVEEGFLERGAQGMYWEAGGTGGNIIEFNSSALASVPDDDFEVIADEVFRIELAFLMDDGTIKADAVTFRSETGPNVKAVIVGIATLDMETRKMMSGNIEDLGEELPDAQNDRDIMSLWGPLRNDSAFLSGDSSFPTIVRANVRFYQRYFYLNYGDK